MRSHNFIVGKLLKKSEIHFTTFKEGFRDETNFSLHSSTTQSELIRLKHGHFIKNSSANFLSSKKKDVFCVPIKRINELISFAPYSQIPSLKNSSNSVELMKGVLSNNNFLKRATCVHHIKKFYQKIYSSGKKLQKFEFLHQWTHITNGVIFNVYLFSSIHISCIFKKN